MDMVFARARVPYRRIGQFGILHQGGHPAYLNETGAQLWELIDGRSTAQQIAGAFGDAQQAPAEMRPQISQTVSTYLSQLNAQGFIHGLGANGAGERRDPAPQPATSARNSALPNTIQPVQEQCMTPRNESGARSLKNQIDRLYWQRLYIQKMHVELTYRCNFRCVHCYNTTHVGGKSELTTGEWDRTLDQLAGMGCSLIIFTGGEVFVRKDIVEILSMACEKGFSFRLNTNGSLIDEKMMRILEPMRPFLQSVDISFYGATPEIHDMLARRPGSYMNTLRGVKLLAEAGMRLATKYVTMHGNFGGIQKFERDMRELGVPFVVHTGSVIPRTDRDITPLVQLLTQEQYRTLIEIRGNPTGGDSPGLCRPGHIRGAITPEGFVSPCEWLTDFKLGNLREQPLKSIWYGPEFQSFRKVFEEEDDCTPCELRPGCGRCPAHSYLETGHLLKCAPVQRKNAQIYHDHVHATA